MGVREDTSPYGERLNKLLGFVPSLAAALSFTVLAVAFVHEWAFYYVVGGQYQSLVGVTDYFNSAIGWLPWVVLGALIAALYSLTDHTRDVPDDIKAEFYKRHRVRWVLDHLPMWLVFWLGLTGGLIHFLIGDWYTRGLLVLVFIFVWNKIRSDYRLS